MLNDNPVRALRFLLSGARMLMQPGLKRFVILPILINIIIFVLLTGWMLHTFIDYYHQAQTGDHWSSWLIWILLIIAGLLGLLVYGYTFNLLTTLIAAPFYGLLAEKIEQRINGFSAPNESVAALIRRTFWRELVKLVYFITRGILVLLVLAFLFFVPLLGGLVALAITTLWSAWCMTIQYTDYAADNHHVAFKSLRQRVRRTPLTGLSLGGLIMFASMIPLVNIIISPVAVAASTLFWLRHGDTATKYERE